MTGDHTEVHRVRAYCGAKPVLIFTRRDSPTRPAWPWFLDTVVMNGRDRDERERSLHEWQQALDPALYWIERLTKPGALSPLLRSAALPLIATGCNQPKSLAVSCQRLPMVRRRSTVRVRQRALQKPRKTGLLFAGTCTISSVRWVWSPLWSLQVGKGPQRGAPSVAADAPMPERSRYQTSSATTGARRRPARIRSARLRTTQRKRSRTCWNTRRPSSARLSV